MTGVFYRAGRISSWTYSRSFRRGQGRAAPAGREATVTGDALGVGYGAIWLTDYDAGAISRIGMGEALRHCRGAPTLRP